jgi:hypothetical protein
MKGYGFDMASNPKSLAFSMDHHTFAPFAFATKNPLGRLREFITAVRHDAYHIASNDDAQPNCSILSSADLTRFCEGRTGFQIMAQLADWPQLNQVPLDFRLIQ